MNAVRVTLGAVMGALLVAGAFAVPALGAPDTLQRRMTASSFADPTELADAFTPAASDPKLAALLARGGVDPSEFRFTPAETRHPSRAITVAVRSRTNRAPQVAERASPAPTPTVGMAPIAYNLGASVGWKHFAVSSEVSHVDMAGMPGSREAVDVGVSYSAKRFTGTVKAGTDRPLGDTVRLTDDPSAYSVDVGGAYSLTHNLSVTAGVRYKSEREQRLQRLDDDRHDSQALYLGTAFRF